MDWPFGITEKNICILLGTLVWVVGNMIYADYSGLPNYLGIHEVVVILFALVGAAPGMIWYKESYLGKTRCIVIGVAIGVVAVLNRREVLTPFVCGVFFIELMSVLLRLLYYRWAKKNGKQNLIAPLMYRFQIRRWSVMLFPPTYKIRDEKKVIRLWLVQFILSTIVLALFKTV